MNRISEWLAALGARPRGARLERIHGSPNFSRGRFRNPVETRLVRGNWLDMLWRQIAGGEKRIPSSALPIVRQGAGAWSTRPQSGLRATWLGHSSVLLEMDAAVVLIDPVLAERSSPVPFAGPRRFHDVPVRIADLPRLDAVVVSHDHYDHLDATVVRALNARNTPFLTTLGVGAHLEKWGVSGERIIELDWGEVAQVGGLTFTSLPARHYSGRGLAGGRTFWSGWALRGRRHAVYYSGDTGWWDDLPSAAAALGPFDLTLIKIGSYGDYWPDVHLTPEQAIRLHRAVKGEALLPVHWGTFNLAHHAWDEPPERLLREASARNVRVVMPRPGEMVEPASAPEPEPWWRAISNAAAARR